MNQSPLVPMRAGYAKPLLTTLAACDGASLPRSAASAEALSAMDLLRVVQSSLDELKLPRGRDLAELKLDVLEEVSAGRLANAVRLAILQSAGAAVDAAGRTVRADA